MVKFCMVSQSQLNMPKYVLQHQNLCPNLEYLEAEISVLLGFDRNFSTRRIGPLDSEYAHVYSKVNGVDEPN